MTVKNTQLRTGRVFVESAAPTVDDDETLGYQVSDIWVYPGDNKTWNLMDASEGAAVWVELTGATGAGGLTYTPTTVTTGNVTAANGNLYACTIAGMTADRDFNLPTPAAAGERIGIFVLDGDDAFEMLIKANSVEITRVFIANEYMTFLSTGTGAGDWKTEVDGRIPCKGFATRAAAQSINTASTTKILLDTSVINIGNMVDVTTNDRINVRRGRNFRRHQAGLYCADRPGGGADRCSYEDGAVDDRLAGQAIPTSAGTVKQRPALTSGSLLQRAK